jgi:hypothetical protein
MISGVCRGCAKQDSKNASSRRMAAVLPGGSQAKSGVFDSMDALAAIHGSEYVIDDSDHLMSDLQ